MISINSIRIGLATTAALTVSSIIAVAPAQALEISFSGTPRTGTQFEFNGPNGIFTATGSYNGNSTAVVTQTNLGLGVRSALIDQFQVDGLGSTETLNLSFLESVRLRSATFATIGYGNAFKLVVDNGQQVIEQLIPGASIFNGFVSSPISFSPSPTGTNFGFSVTDSNDAYYLSAIDVTAVPTPAAVLPALIGMGTAAFRKKKHEGEEELAFSGVEEA